MKALCIFLYALSITLYLSDSKKIPNYFYIFTLLLSWPILYYIFLFSNVTDEYYANTILSIVICSIFYLGMALALYYLNESSLLPYLHNILFNISTLLFSIYTLRNFFFILNTLWSKRKSNLIIQKKKSLGASSAVLLILFLTSLYILYYHYNKTYNEVHFTWAIGVFLFFIVFNFQLYKYLANNDLVLFPLVL